MSVASLMNTTVNIETLTQSKNSSGLLSRTWAVRSEPSGSALAARAMDLDERTMLEYGRLGYDATTVFYFASDPLLSGYEVTSRIVWGGDAYYLQKVQNSGGKINKLFKVVAVKKALNYSTTG